MSENQTSDQTGWWAIPVGAIVGAIFPFVWGETRRLLLDGDLGWWAVPLFSFVGVFAASLLYFSQKVRPEKLRTYWTIMGVVGSVLIIVLYCVVADIMGW